MDRVHRAMLLVALVLLSGLDPGLLRAQEPPSRASFEDTVETRLAEANALWEADHIDGAVAILENLVDRAELPAMGRAYASTLYALACGRARLGQRDQALADLGRATETGFIRLAYIESDPDLDSIRGLPGYLALRERLEAFDRLWKSPILDTPYRADLPVDEKVAGLSKLWSEIKYNFAFFDRVPAGVDWDSLYVAYLPRVRQTTSTLEYYRALREMTARLHDGHTGVNVPPELYDAIGFRPAIRTGLVEGRVLIREVAAGAESLTSVPLSPGLEIVGVDGIPVREYAARRVLPYVRASTPWGRNVAAFDYDLLLGRRGDICELEVTDDGGRSTVTVRLPRDVPVMVRPDAEPRTEWLADRIARLTIDSFADNGVAARFDTLFAGLATSAGLIIDLRDNGGGNGGVAYALLARLTDRPFSTLRCTCRDYRPLRRAVGAQEGWYLEKHERWPVDATMHYAKPVVVLIGPRTGSAAEDFCATFRSMQRGTLIGETTAGSTGQPLVFALPGGGNAMVCTARCTSPDGEAIVGVGVPPDIEVHPTVEDIKAGRDAVLEAARRALRQGDAGAHRTSPGSENRE
ncbi:MAG: S41 family peptidase [Candidatus Eiseniibacteriota bacterium]|jgi:C-terminal processing protease CtpA/Prc